MEALGLEKIIPVGHDAGGPTAVNFALKHPERAAAVCLMNAFYGDAPGLRVPELIELFANKSLKSLTRHFLASSQQFAWLLAFQRDQMQIGLTEAQKAHYTQFLGPIIDNNFRQRPSAGPAFAQMTYQYSDEIAANMARLADFRRSDVPLLLIWESPTPIFMSPSPSTCDLRPGMLRFMSLERGIGPRSTSLLMSLGLCLRASDCEKAWQVGLARRAENAGCLFTPPLLNSPRLVGPTCVGAKNIKARTGPDLGSQRQRRTWVIFDVPHLCRTRPVYLNNRKCGAHSGIS